MSLITIENLIVHEANNIAYVIVRLRTPVTQTVTVDFRTEDISASSATDRTSDYTAVQGTLTFAPNEVEKRIAIQLTRPDAEYDQRLEHFRVVLSNAANAVIGNTSAIVSLVDSSNFDRASTRPQISVRDVVVDEKAGVATFVVSTAGWRTGQTVDNNRFYVDYATAGGSATAGSDFQARSGTLTFDSEVTTLIVSVPIVDDIVAEGAEWFSLTLSNPFLADIRDGTAIAWIAASDTPAAASPGVRVGDMFFNESDGWVDVEVSLSAPSSSQVSVDYRTVNITADQQDFGAEQGRLVFAPGEMSRTVRIATISPLYMYDTLETFAFTLTAAQGATIERSVGWMFMGDDDRDSLYASDSVRVADVIVNESAGKVTFVVRVDSSDSYSQTVLYRTVNGSATAGTDYVAASGSLVFYPNETIKTITVDLMDDALAEGAERFYLEVDEGDGARRNAAFAEIAANDAAPVSQPRLSADAPYVVDWRAAYTEFAVRLDAPSASTVTVAFRTRDAAADPAAANPAFTAIEGLLTFLPGQTMQTVRTPLLVPNIELVLSGAANAVIERASAVAVIGGPSQVGPAGWYVGDVTVDEKAGKAVFVVSLGEPVSETGFPYPLSYATETTGTATAGSDFVATSGTVYFLPGDRVKTIEVPLIDDALAEGAETFTLRLASSYSSMTRAVGTATITASDAAPVSAPRLSVAPLAVIETARWAEVVVSLSAPSAQVVTVDYRATDASAVAGGNGDFLRTAGTLSFAPGQTTQTVRVLLVDDGTAEPVEAFRFDLSSPQGATIDSPQTFVTITDEVVLPQYAYPYPEWRVRSIEVDEAAGQAVFEVTLGDGASLRGAGTVTVSTADGTAAAGSDYQAISTTLTFLQGESVKRVVVPLIDDGNAEGAETFTLRLQSSSGIPLTVDSSATATIAPSDQATVAAPGVRLGEAEFVGEGQGWFDVVVSLTSPSAGEVLVDYATRGLSAEAGTDFVGATGRLRFAPGEVLKTVRLLLVDNAVSEKREAFRFDLTGAAGATIETDSSLVTIFDNDRQDGTLELFAEPVLVDEKAGRARFVVRGGADGDTYYLYAFANFNAQLVAGGAEAGSDMLAPAGPFSFTPTQTFRVIDVPIVDDGAAEGPESFQLRLTAVPSWLRIGTEFIPATIAASDAQATASPRLRVDDVVVDERQPTARFVVSLDAPSTGVVRVDWAALPGSAAPGLGSDYFADGGTLHFAPGETTKVVQVALVDDTAVERPEQFAFVLGNAVGATLARGAATATVLDNDIVLATPALHVADVVVDESARTASVTVSLGADGGQAGSGRITVAYATVADSAAAGSDYVARSGTLTFLPGESAKTVVVDLVDDNLAEGSESFGVELSAPTGATLGRARGAVTIWANDQAPAVTPGVELQTASTLLAERDGFVDVLLTLSAPSAGVTSVLPRLVPVGSTGADFFRAAPPAAQPVVFAPGQTMALWRVPLVDDDLAEGIESFRLELESPVGLSAAPSTLLHVIDNDEVVPTPTLHVRDAVVDESAGVARFVVTLGRSRVAASVSPVSVDYATADLTATAGGDYQAVSGTLVFQPGETLKIITVPIVDDSVAEGVERLALQLSSPTGATIADGRALARIGASDGAAVALPVLSVSDGAVVEGDGWVDLVATLSAPSTTPVVLDFTVAASGTEPARNGRVRFAPGQTSATLRVDILDDAMVQVGDTRRVDLVLAASSGATLARTAALVRVEDNDRAGVDLLANGDGDDIYVVDAATDIVVEGPEQGYDRVRSSVSYDIPLDVEVLELTGSGAIDARGGERADLLLGNAGNNLLDGGAGDDTLDGAGGEDTLRGGAGNDRYIVDNLRDVVEDTGGGRDTVVSSVSFTLPAQVEDIELAGGDAINASGNSAANRLMGNAAANSLLGDEGDDTLIGGAGDDLLTGEVGADLFVFATSGNGVDVINGWDAGDRVLIEGVALSTAAPTPGNGSTVSGRRIEIGSTSGYTDLWIDTDGNAGAEIRIQVRNDGLAARFVVTNTAEGASIARIFNAAPTVAAAMTDRVATASGAATIVVPAGTFADANADALTYSATLASGAALPGWLRFDAARGVFFGIPGAGDVGKVDVRLRATDPQGASAFDDFQILVAPAGFNALNYVASHADLRSSVGPDALKATQDYIDTGRSQGRTISFDPPRYTAAYPDLIAAFGADTVAAASHYIVNGANEGRNLLFDGRIYWATNAVVRAQAGSGLTALAHHYLVSGEPARVNFTLLEGLRYVASHGDLLAAFGRNESAGVNHFFASGFAEGRAVTFEPLAYIASYVDLIGAFGGNANAGLNHYFDNGFAEGRRAIFDPLRYTASYGDLINAFGTNENASAFHFIATGFGEGRQAGFDARQYWATNQAARADAGTNLSELARHFITQGFGSGATALIDGLRYIASYADLGAVFGLNASAGVNHFLNAGFSEGRAVTFDPWRYLASNADLMNAFGTDLTAATQHYITTGRSQGRSLSAFDPWQYMLANPDVRVAYNANVDGATRHYVVSGRGEGRTVGLVAVPGTPNADTLNGTAADEVLSGGAGNDVLDGGAGSDLLVGGAGSDIATGGAGADIFSFGTPSEGADAITDFTSETDVLLFSSAGFAGLAQGKLDPLRLAGSSAELGARAGFVYDPLTGSLSFDPDGAGALAPTAIAGLGANRTLAPTDIVIGP